MRKQLPVHSPVRLVVTLGRRRRARALRRLRALLATTFGAREVVLCGSGTEGLLLALRWLEPRDERDSLAIPGYTCYDVGAAAVASGWPLRVYDVDPAALAPDHDSLLAALRAGASVVVVTPLYGVPVDWDALEALAAPFGARLVEDAAQGHGATWRGRPLGSLGARSVLSFSRGKGWTGIRGGAVLLRGDAHDGGRESHGDWQPLPPPGEASARAEPAPPSSFTEARVVAVAAAQRLFGRPTLYGLPAALPWLGLGETRYRPAPAPRRLTPTSAEMLLASRQAADEEVPRRRENAARWEQVVAGSGTEPVRPPDGAEPGWLRYPVRIPDGVAGLGDPRTALASGVAPGYPRPLAELAPVAERLVERSPTPGADALARQLVTLPTHGLVTVRDRERIARALPRRVVASPPGQLSGATGVS